MGYKAACGLSDGQIIGAHIIYAEAQNYAVSMQSVETVSTPIEENEQYLWEEKQYLYGWGVEIVN